MERSPIMSSNTCRRRLVALTSLTLILLVGVGLVTMPGVAYVLGVENTNNLNVSSSERQVIEGIEVQNDEYPVTVEVGEVVEAGAVLDDDASSYDITNGQTASESEVTIQNRASTEATIIVDSNALKGEETFDLVISDIDTTGVSGVDTHSESTKEEITYEIVRDIDGWETSVQTSFNIQTNASIQFRKDPYDRRFDLIELTDIKLENGKTDHVAIWELDQEGNLDEKLASSQSPGNTAAIKIPELTGDVDLKATIHPSNETLRDDVIYDSNKTTISVPPEGDLQYNNLTSDPGYTHEKSSTHSASLSLTNNSTTTQSDLRSIDVDYDSSFHADGGS